MLDQNITTLLAALIGGLLSALGGFFANYYIQSTSDKISKKKEIRNMAEKVFKKTDEISQEHLNILDNLSNLKNLKDSARKITLALSQIEFMVNFYLPPLREDFAEYKGKFDNLIDAIEFHNLEDLTTYENTHKLSKVSKKYQLSIIAFYNKEGYSYF
ncbi:hypothetical protein [Dictyobacter formicarum]|uniref:Uncharacterized protein n=1 Tax=Dictyobacter formicarum TaxID=2778368 RepID=A0ABQ3VR60_9CHLR|nr:hypothetical protein [Dictyobacter formicarum]GHO88305.1 hypothetical protein KSZ_63110 [Dictyobacter formicarum]